jgi:hypothetical protein
MNVFSTAQTGIFIAKNTFRLQKNHPLIVPPELPSAA